MVILLPFLLLALWLLWILGSGAALSHLGFFSSRPLAAAPQRESQFTLLHVAAVAMIYIGFSVLVGVALMSMGLLPHSSPAATAPALATTSAPATTPATAPSTMTATASAPATAPGHVADAEEVAIAQAAESAVRIFATAIILLMASQMVVGGFSGFGLRWTRFPAGLKAGLLAAILLVPWFIPVEFIVMAISQALRHGPVPRHPLLQALVEQPSPFAYAVIIFAAVVVAPISEEIFFRGLLQTALLRYGRRPTPPAGPEAPASTDVSDEVPRIYITSPPPTPTGDVPAAWRWFAIIVSSLLFAAIHLGNGAEQPPIILVLAIALGYLYERTGNLWGCICLHAMFNIFGTVMTLFFGS